MSDFSVADNVRQEIEEQGMDLVAKAQGASIVSQATYEAVADLAREAKAFLKEVDKVWKEPVEAAHRAHKAATTARKKQREPYEKAERICKSLLNEWDAEQRRIAAEKARKEEEERLEAAAIIAEAGNEKLADEIISAPVPPVIHVEKPSGVSYIDNWKARVIDPVAVPDFFGGMRLKIVDEKAINALAKAAKGQNPPAGIEYYNDRTTRII